MNEKNKAITSRDEDFARWYTDVILKTELVDYSPVKGFMVIRPYGYAIWENIQKICDKKFKETGHKNMYFPLLIPESLLKKEAEHVEGFAPEVAWVTHGGDKELGEKLCIRPTSETIICSMYAKWLNSYRQLPFLYNQWCNVVRWEKTTRPFLRTSEFLWQEGHTLHETENEAKEETLRMLNIYKDLCENYLAMPVVSGQKSEKEKFAGAIETYTIEALMHDGQALQSGTSHYFGKHFTEAFDIKYLDRENKQQNPYHSSWGISTRLIGGIIMTHGDDNGLVLPPAIAPTQVVVIPIKPNNEKVKEEVNKIKNDLIEYRIEIDDDDSKNPGWKFSEWEMKGVPLRIEIGPRDIENNKCIIARRDTGEKIEVSLENLKEEIIKLLEEVQDNLYKKALDARENKTSAAYNLEEIKNSLNDNPGFIKIMWDGTIESEEILKAETGATIRCIVEEDNISDKCAISGNPAKHLVYIARAY